MRHAGQGAKAQLRDRVQELGSELQSAEEEVAALEGLQEQLAAEVDADEQIQALVAAAVAREHAVQESRNRKVLDLLSSKVGMACMHLIAKDCMAVKALLLPPAFLWDHALACHEVHAWLAV